MAPGVLCVEKRTPVGVRSVADGVCVAAHDEKLDLCLTGNDDFVYSKRIEDE